MGRIASSAGRPASLTSGRLMTLSGGAVKHSIDPGVAGKSSDRMDIMPSDLDQFLLLQLERIVWKLALVGNRHVAHLVPVRKGGRKLRPTVGPDDRADNRRHAKLFFDLTPYGICGFLARVDAPTDQAP